MHNKGVKYCWIFSETAPLQSQSPSSNVWLLHESTISPSLISTCTFLNAYAKSTVHSFNLNELLITVTYSVGNRGQKNCGVFSQTAPLQRSSTPSVESHTCTCTCTMYIQSAIFLWKARMHAHYSIPRLIVGHKLSCHRSCLQARSAHNSMISWRAWHRGFCTLVHSYYSFTEPYITERL